MMSLRCFSTERFPLYLKKFSFGLISWSFEIVDRRTILIITFKIEHKSISIQEDGAAGARGSRVE